MCVLSRLPAPARNINWTGAAAAPRPSQFSRSTLRIAKRYILSLLPLEYSIKFLEAAFTATNWDREAYHKTTSYLYANYHLHIYHTIRITHNNDRFCNLSVATNINSEIRLRFLLSILSSSRSFGKIMEMHLIS